MDSDLCRNGNALAKPTEGIAHQQQMFKMESIVSAVLNGKRQLTVKPKIS
jgi:hypothetical protein